jgi:peptidoglycan hydrolase CwlO-like protein
MTKLQKNDLMILLESIDSKVQVTMESVSRLDNKIDAVKDELKEDIAILDCKIMGLSGRVDAVEKNLSERIDAVDKKVDAVDKKVDAVDKKVDVVYKELVAHRNDTELHRSQPKRSLKRVV